VRIGIKLALIALSFFGVANAREPIRIDASSDASAQTSWNQMLAQASRQTQQKLQVAMLQLNLSGVNSAYEVVGSPDLQNLSIMRIKDKVAGLTAEQIIELADRTSTVKVEQHSR